MKKKVIIFIFLIIVVIGAVVIFYKCQKQSDKTGFSKKIAPYSKEDIVEYEKKLNGNILVIKYTGDLHVIKENVHQAKVCIKKSVGGKRKELLDAALENITCSINDDGSIKIESKIGKESEVNSVNIDTTIVLPNTIQSIELTGDNGNVTLDGDYDNIQSNIDTGDMSYTGKLKECTINSNCGNVRLDLKDIKNSYKFTINGGIGDVEIKVPVKSVINLDNKIEDIKIGNNIKLDKEGATIKITNAISDINISSSY